MTKIKPAPSRKDLLTLNKLTKSWLKSSILFAYSMKQKVESNENNAENMFNFQ